MVLWCFAWTKSFISNPGENPTNHSWQQITSSADLCKEFCAFILHTVTWDLKRITASAFALLKFKTPSSALHCAQRRWVQFHLKLECHCGVRTGLQTEWVVAVWDQLCQSFGMPAHLFCTVLSAGETGLAERLVHSEFLLRTVGMVTFLAPLRKHTPLCRLTGWDSEVVQLEGPSWLISWNNSSITCCVQLQRDTQDQNHASVNFQRHTLPLWLLVCVSRSGQNGSSVRGRSAGISLEQRSSSASCVFDRKWTMPWGFFSFFSLSSSEHLKVYLYQK